MTQPKTTRHIREQAAVVAAQLISESGGITQAERDKLAFITVTLAIDLDTLASSVDANNAKVSNVTTDLSIGVVDATSVEIVSSDGTNAVIPLATGALAGLMSAADKAKLDAIP